MLLDGKLATPWACVMHKKRLLALLGNMLNSKSCRDHLVSSLVAAYVMVLAYAVLSLCSASCRKLCKHPVVCRLGASVLAGFVSSGPAPASHWLLQHHQGGAYPPPTSHCQGPYRSDTLVLVSMVGRQLWLPCIK